MKSNNTEVFKTIMNPSTGKMVQSGGQLGKKIIKDYKAETIYNPLTGKQVKTGGSVGKKVLGMYKAKGGESCSVNIGETQHAVTLCDIAKLPIVQEALKEKKNANAAQTIKSQEEVKKANNNANTAAAAVFAMETPEARQMNTIGKFVEDYKDIYTKKIQKIETD